MCVYTHTHTVCCRCCCLYQSGGWETFGMCDFNLTLFSSWASPLADLTRSHLSDFLLNFTYHIRHVHTSADMHAQTHSAAFSRLLKSLNKVSWENSWTDWNKNVKSHKKKVKKHETSCIWMQAKPHWHRRDEASLTHPNCKKETASGMWAPQGLTLRQSLLSFIWLQTLTLHTKHTDTHKPHLSSALVFLQNCQILLFMPPSAQHTH